MLSIIIEVLTHISTQNQDESEKEMFEVPLKLCQVLLNYYLSMIEQRLPFIHDTNSQFYFEKSLFSLANAMLNLDTLISPVLFAPCD